MIPSFAGALLGLLVMQPSQEPAAAPPAQETYANPELLVSTEWLAGASVNASVRVVDAREREAFEAEHLPGALHLPRSATFARDGQGSMLASRDALVALLGATGIARDTHVVIYDEGRDTAAARVFWTLEVLGHPKVSVLDGGIAKWRAEGRATTDEASAPTSVEYEAGAALRDELITSKEEMMTCLDTEGSVPLDVRSDGEWSRGHVPRAVHIEWTRNFAAAEIDGTEVTTYLAPADLRALYEGAGITRDVEVHMY